MTTFQIIIDCQTDHGAFYFMDARGRTDAVLRNVKRMTQEYLANLSHAEPINVTGAALVKTIQEFVA